MKILSLGILFLLVAVATASGRVYQTEDKTQLMWYTPGKYSVSCFYQVKSSGFFKKSPKAGFVQCKSHRASTAAWIDGNGHARARTNVKSKPTFIQKNKGYVTVKPGWSRSWKKTGVSCRYTKKRAMLCSKSQDGVIRGFLIDNRGIPSAVYLSSNRYEG